MVGRYADVLIKVQIFLWRLGDWSVCRLEGDVEKQGTGAGVVTLDYLNRFPGEKFRRELAISLIGHLTIVMPVITFHVLITELSSPSSKCQSPKSQSQDQKDLG